MLAAFHKQMSFSSLRKRERFVDHRLNLSFGNGRPNVLLHFANNHGFIFETSITQASRYNAYEMHKYKITKLDRITPQKRAHVQIMKKFAVKRMFLLT